MQNQEFEPPSEGTWLQQHNAHLARMADASTMMAASVPLPAKNTGISLPSLVDLALPDLLRRVKAPSADLHLLDLAADEIERLRGEAAVMRGLLRECAAVMATFAPESDEESENIVSLLNAIAAAVAVPGAAEGALL